MRRLAFVAALAAVLLAVPGCAPARPTDGRGRWLWYNPRPVGNHLKAVHLVSGDMGWAVGARGTILWSHDRGLDGTTQCSGTTADLEDVCFVSPGTGWAVGAGGTILKTTDQGRSWVKAASPTTARLRAVDLVSKTAGWAVGSSGVLVRTTDGVRWTASTISTYALYGVDFLDADRGWACGSGGVVLKTTNGGATWKKATTSFPGNVAVTGIRMTGRSTGWATGWSGTAGSVWRTTDGGATWEKKKEIAWVRVESVAASGTAEAWACGDQGKVAHTADGGATWDETVTVGAHLYGIDVSDGVVACVGDFGTVSLDEGSGFDRPGDAAMATADLNDVAENGETAFAVGGAGTILKERASSQLFERAAVSGPAEELRCVDFFGTDDGWAGSRAGKVVRTTDAGVSWEVVGEVPRMWIEDLEFVDASTGFAAGWRDGQGLLVRTTDAGSTWTTLTATPYPLYGLSFPAPERGYAVGQHGQLVVILPSEVTTATVPGVSALWGVSFVTTTTGWAVGDGGAVVRTRDGAATWVRQASGVSQALRDVHFRNEAEGWAVAAGGRVLQTGDGGESWVAENAGTGADLRAVTAIGDRVYAAGKSGAVLVHELVRFQVTESSGSDRYRTAVAASRQHFPAGSVTTVVVATGEGWPDAISGAALAGAYGSPILLTKRGSLPKAVGDEIQRLGATGAVVLGGPAAVSDTVLAAIRPRTGRGGRVSRIWGDDRYETAAKAAAEAVRVRKARGLPYDGVAFIATGLDWPDAVAVSPISAHKVEPLLLVKRGTATAPTLKALAGICASEAVVVGSAKVVGREVEEQVERVVGKPVTRLQGKDRYGTARAVAVYGAGHGMRTTDIGLATGLDYPDALAGGVAMGRNAGLLALTKPGKLGADAAALIDGYGAVRALHFFGSTKALPQAVRDEAEWTMRSERYGGP